MRTHFVCLRLHRNNYVQPKCVQHYYFTILRYTMQTLLPVDEYFDVIRLFPNVYYFQIHIFIHLPTTYLYTFYFKNLVILVNLELVITDTWLISSKYIYKQSGNFIIWVLTPIIIWFLFIRQIILRLLLLIYNLSINKIHSNENCYLSI